jgi:hypothetical protein
MNQIKNHGWIVSGSAVGFGLGAFVNLRNTSSLFGKSSLLCHKAFEFLPFQIINEYRENDLTVSRLGNLTPFNPFYPLIHLVPMSLFCLQNIKSQNMPCVKGVWQNLTKSLAFPLVTSISMCILGYAARDILFSPKEISSVEISGHVIIQCAIHFHAVKALAYLSELGTQKQRRLYSALNIGVMISDAIWVYKTSAYCHSVAEVVGGLFCATLAGLCVAGVPHFLSFDVRKTFNRMSHCLCGRAL